MDDIILGGDLNVLRPKKGHSGVFFSYYLSNFKKTDIARIAQGYSVVHLYSSHLKKLKIYTPIFEEQQKIADFLTKVDEWIENLRQQKENLEKYKKGMMQKIFAQKIRFKEENGKKFESWKEFYLDDLGKTYNGLTNKTADDFGVGEIFITYKQIFDNDRINVNRFSLVKVKPSEKQNKAKFGDIFFTTSSETPEEVGFASVLLDDGYNPYLNSFCFGFRPNISLDPFFARCFFRSAIYRKEVIRLAQGSTRYNISKNEFLKIKINLPLSKEQQEIAEFFTSIDEIINSKQQQAAKAEEWKKGLMQGLFV